MPFIDLTKNGDLPVLIDPATISSLYATKTTIAVFGAKGILYRGDTASSGIDVDDALGKIKTAGVELLPVTEGYSGVSGKAATKRYVSPAAVTFITASIPRETDGNRNAVIGLTGTAPRIETTLLSQQEFDALAAAVSRAKPMMRFGAGEAHARVYDPDTLLVDPALVTQVRVDSVQVNLTFSGTDWLDVQAAHCDEQAVMRQVRRDNPQAEGYALMKLIGDTRDARQEAARNALAKKIASANGALIEVPGAQRATFLRQEDVGCLFLPKEKADEKPMLHIVPPQDGQRVRDGVIIYFNSAARREAAVKALAAVPSGPGPARPKPRK